MVSKYVMPRDFNTRAYSLRQYSPRPPSSLAKITTWDSHVLLAPQVTVHQRKHTNESHMRFCSRPSTVSSSGSVSSSRRSIISSSDIDTITARLTRPTLSSRYRNKRQIINVNVISSYSWDVPGIRSYTDTAKCMYLDNGCVKSGTCRGKYKLAR